MKNELSSLSRPAGIIKQSGNFFPKSITPIEKKYRTALQTKAHLKELNKRLHRRTVALAAANQQLKQEIVQRKRAEESFKKGKQHYAKLLDESRLMQEQLRHLSRQLLSAQEEERKKISRELHDEIAQTLTGINVHLATLKTEAAVNTQGLKKKITRTQRLVEKSVDIVHRFARELRPTMLDDLGLIPTLHSYMKDFKKRSGIHVRFTAFAGVEQARNDKQTVLYRVAQSALTNVARHAQASRVSVSIQKLPDAIRMQIQDNGKGFQVERALLARGRKRLGLLGMRERVEMVGGSFAVESAPGKGTTIRAQIPFLNDNRA